MQDAEGAVDRERRRTHRGPGHDRDQAPSPAATRSPATARSAARVFDSPPQTAADNPALAMPPPTNPPISACELEDGMPSAQVTRFQTIAPIRAAKITGVSITLGFDDAGPDGAGDVEPEHHEGDEVEEGGPEHRVMRPQHPRGYDGRDRIGGVVQSVEEVEQQRDRDQSDQDGKTSVASNGWPCPIPVRSRCC